MLQETRVRGPLPSNTPRQWVGSPSGWAHKDPIPTKQSYVVTKETLFIVATYKADNLKPVAKEPFIHTKEAYTPTKEPQVLTQEN